jgi:hypothetical protein
MFDSFNKIDQDLTRHVPVFFSILAPGIVILEAPSWQRSDYDALILSSERSYY